MLWLKTLLGNEKTTADTVVSHALSKLGEREAGFKMKNLLKESMKYAISDVSSVQ